MGQGVIRDRLWILWGLRWLKGRQENKRKRKGGIKLTGGRKKQGVGKGGGEGG